MIPMIYVSLIIIASWKMSPFFDVFQSSERNSTMWIIWLDVDYKYSPLKVMPSQQDASSKCFPSEILQGRHYLRCCFMLKTLSCKLLFLNQEYIVIFRPHIMGGGES